MAGQGMAGRGLAWLGMARFLYSLEKWRRKAKMEIEDAVIGEDKPEITAKRVVIADYEVEKDIKDKEGKVIGDKLNLLVDHPDVKDRKIGVSSVRYEQKGKIKQSGLWIKLDSENKLPYRGAVATMLRFLGKGTIKELRGLEVATTTDDAGYLTIKAY